MKDGDVTLTLALGLSGSAAGVAAWKNTKATHAIAWLSNFPRAMDEIPTEHLPDHRVRDLIKGATIVRVEYQVNRNPVEEVVVYTAIKPFFNGSLLPVLTWSGRSFGGQLFCYKVQPDGSVSDFR